MPAGYIRLAWEAEPADANELRAIYEQVLLALSHFHATDLMTVHGQRPPLPPDVQAWLGSYWVPRAVATVGYGRCAIVEANALPARHSARVVVDRLTSHVDFQYFASETDAHDWLMGRL